jgi:hypothetical protein
LSQLINQHNTATSIMEPGRSKGIAEQVQSATGAAAKAEEPVAACIAARIKACKHPNIFRNQDLFIPNDWSTMGSGHN